MRLVVIYLHAWPAAWIHHLPFGKKKIPLLIWVLFFKTTGRIGVGWVFLAFLDNLIKNLKACSQSETITEPDWVAYTDLWDN